MFTDKILKYEDYFRGQYTLFLYVVLLCLTAVNDMSLYSCLPIYLIGFLFFFFNLIKLKRESIVNYYFRNSLVEMIGYFAIILFSIFLLFISKYSSQNHLFLYAFGVLLFGILSTILSLIARAKEKEFIIHQKFKDKVHVGIRQGFLLYSPVFLERRPDPSHSLAFGVTGSAKTMGVLLPNITHDIAVNNFVVIIEPKGDKGLRDRVYSLCKRHNRVFKYISISNAELSSKYNPFGFGDANSVKDKIMSSTDWSEEFYKKVADAELSEVLGEIIKNNSGFTKRENFNGIGLDKVVKLIPQIKELAGLNAFFKSVKLSSYSTIFATEGETIYDFYKGNCVVYISLDSLAYPLAAQSLGRIVLQDLSTLVGYVYNNVPKDKRIDTGVYIDEMATFFSTGFLTFLSQARDAKFTINMAAQSPSDFKAHGDWALARLVDNTPVKYILALQDPDSAEYCAKILGTREFIKHTYQTENDGDQTGRGSSRDAHQFNFSPDTVKGLDQFHGVLYDRISKFKALVEFKTIFFDDLEITEYKGEIKTAIKPNKKDIEAIKGNNVSTIKPKIPTLIDSDEALIDI